MDARGEVIGINTFLVSSSDSFSGMGFAIPTQIVRPTVEALIRDGKVTHGYMGIGISDVTPENAKFFHVENNEGAVISQVESGSPAREGRAESRRRHHRTRRPESQRRQPTSDRSRTKAARHEHQAGSPARWQARSIPVTLEAMGSRDKDGKEIAANDHGKARWGIGLTDITPELREQLQASNDVHGAVVEQVQPGSAADNAGLQRGDVIVEVNRHPVQNAADVQKALSAVPNGQDALVLVWSSGGTTFRVLHAAAANEDKPGM